MSDDRAYLAHIRDALERIARYTTGGRTAFLEDSRTQDAVIRNLEIIGEASKKLSAETRARTSAIPWKAIVGMRDRLTHAYFGTDLEIVWRVVEGDLPTLNAAIGQLINDVPGQ